MIATRISTWSNRRK